MPCEKPNLFTRLIRDKLDGERAMIGPWVLEDGTWRRYADGNDCVARVNERGAWSAMRPWRDVTPETGVLIESGFAPNLAAAKDAADQHLVKAGYEPPIRNDRSRT